MHSLYICIYTYIYKLHTNYVAAKKTLLKVRRHNKIRVTQFAPQQKAFLHLLMGRMSAFSGLSFCAASAAAHGSSFSIFCASV